MVSVIHSVSLHDTEQAKKKITAGLSTSDQALIAQALEFAVKTYNDMQLDTGEVVWSHAVGVAMIAAALKLDTETRLSAILFYVDKCLDNGIEVVKARFGETVASLAAGVNRLSGLHVFTHTASAATAPEIRAQAEVLRKMLLAMVEDIRVVLLRLASCTQTLRYYTRHPSKEREMMARESLDIYAPLANRLGIWQLKWELEDLSFRFLEPDTYKCIAKMLDERRTEREVFIRHAIGRLKKELEAVGVQADIAGRPKHIYSIYNKMQAKRLDFSQIYDIRALRVLVDEVKDCYAVLGVVHQLWQPIGQEFDDYIAKPKNNDYRSLHTAVRAEDGRALEVQIRTHDMHRHAELGFAAHWRYKEGTGRSGGEYDEKISLLRNLLSWRDEVADSADWVEQFKRVSLDDTLYVLTPQGRVIDLPCGATPVDFAYRLHTNLGHRCRGAKVDGQLVPLNTGLATGQTVEIVTVKEGGPSRDWLDARQKYVMTTRARNKIKRYFSLLEEEELLAKGRALVTREVSRDGHSQTNMDELAGRLGFKGAESLFLAAGRGEVGTRSVQMALRESEAAANGQRQEADPGIVVGRSRSGDHSDKVLLVGVGRLMTTLSRCCRPAPPDAIGGFVTRGRGVSIHRLDCKDLKRLIERQPERLIEAQWGDMAYDEQSVYPIDIAVQADDRQGLLRDISDVLSREKLNVTAVNTVSKRNTAYMRFTMEVKSISQLQRAMTLIHEVPGVVSVERK